MRRAFSVSIFPRHAGRILLIFHRRLKEWLPPGGELEAGELPLEAARRELREETGLDGDFAGGDTIEGTPAGLIGYEEHEAGQKGLHGNFVFVADVATDRITANEEFTDYRWIDSFEGVVCAANVRQLGERALAGDLEGTARRWLAAFNAGDLDALLALYADEAIHTSPRIRTLHPETGGALRGKEALRRWWSEALGRLPGLRYDECAVTASADRVFLEYDRVVPGEPTTRVAELFRLRGGRILESRVYPG